MEIISRLRRNKTHRCSTSSPTRGTNRRSTRIDKLRACCTAVPQQVLPSSDSIRHRGRKGGYYMIHRNPRGEYSEVGFVRHEASPQRHQHTTDTREKTCPASFYYTVYTKTAAAAAGAATTNGNEQTNSDKRPTWLASGAARRAEDRRPSDHLEQEHHKKQHRHVARGHHGVVRVDGLRDGGVLRAREPPALVHQDPTNDCPTKEHN